eukprot:TRINITY_DN5467_c0_g1_i1.p1 TRINITY_DN5467_c0_g1~~TRINITY_DN5467_c0_g1_i1.p1  ORF type:complete len:266 (-),score=47.35 TRINITY_DN5467_c0_g1_i1:69-866(-)
MEVVQKSNTSEVPQNGNARGDRDRGRGRDGRGGRGGGRGRGGGGGRANREASFKKQGVTYWKHMPHVTEAELRAEAELEGMLFGDVERVTDDLGKEVDGSAVSAAIGGGVETGEGLAHGSKKRKRKQKAMKPVWHDEDDDTLQVVVGGGKKAKKDDARTVITATQFANNLRATHAAYSQPEWAQVKEDEEDNRGDEEQERDEEDEEDEEAEDLLFRSTGGYVAAQERTRITRVADANCKAPSKVRSVTPHPHRALNNRDTPHRLR